MVNVINPKFNS